MGTEKSITGFNVGDRVLVTKLIAEGPDECSPGGVLARRGELLVIRMIYSSGAYPIYVSHEDVLDSAFGVTLDEISDTLDEIKPITIDENGGKLAYDVKISGWSSVAKIMREFKKKKHRGFYLEVNDLGSEFYQVKVYS